MKQPYKLYKNLLGFEAYADLKSTIGELPVDSDYFRDNPKGNVLHFNNDRLNNIILRIVKELDGDLNSELGQYGIDEIAIFRPVEFKKNISSYLHHDNLGSIIRVWMALEPVYSNSTTRLLTCSRESFSYKLIDFFERNHLRHKLNRKGFSFFLKLRDFIIELRNIKNLVDFELETADCICWNANYLHRAKMSKGLFADSYFDNRSYLTIQFTNTEKSYELFNKGVRIVGFEGKSVEVNSKELKERLHLFGNNL